MENKFVLKVADRTVIATVCITDKKETIKKTKKNCDSNIYWVKFWFNHL